MVHPVRHAAICHLRFGLSGAPLLVRHAAHPRDVRISKGEKLAQFLAATGRRLRVLGKVICHFFRKGKLRLKLAVKVPFLAEIEASLETDWNRRHQGTASAALFRYLSDRRRLGSALEISQSGSWPIAASKFLFDQVEEQPNRFLFPFEHMLFLLAAFSDPPPSPGQAGLSEHRLLDLHGIVPRHVLGWVRSFDIELVGLRNHAGMILTRRRHVQRHM
ncbi:hypothetical protein ACVIDN_007433 [Rhizobium brockwellii]